MQFHPTDLLMKMDPDSIRVHPPTSIVFLCGGVFTDATIETKVLRDAFNRVALTGAFSYNIILAEAAQPLTDDAGYSDLLTFEADIAQVVGLILLFAESPGSLAELGAFAALPTVAPSLLAVIHEYYYNRSSFIRNGPIRFLEKKFDEEWILTIDQSEAKTDEHGNVVSINTEKLISSVAPAVEKRLKKRQVWQKFSQNNNGHLILYIVGLCQEFGAMTIREIRSSVDKFGIEYHINNLIYCAELCGWIKKIRKGNNIYYVGVPGGQALDYKIEVDASRRDKLRWRTDIRAYWKLHESARFNAITDVVSPQRPST